MSRPTILALACVLLSLAPAARAAGEGSAALYAASFEAELDGDYATALNKTLEVLRASPRDYTATLRTGWLYYKKGQHEDAVSAYRKAAELVLGAIEPKLGLTLPLLALQRWKEAAEVCQDVLTIAPADYFALSRLAYARYSQGAYAAALTHYDTVLRRYPSDTEMQLGRAWTLLKLGRRDEARAAFRQVLAVYADNVSARAGLDAL